MRSLVLNSAGVSGLSVDRRALTPWLRDAVSGMSQLVHDRVAQPELLMQRGIHEIRCLPECSLFDVALDLLRGSAKDESDFLLTVTSRARWTEDLDPADRDRLLACEEQELPGRDGEPLMLCVVIGGIAVGFPSSGLWDSDRIAIRFEELLPNDTIEERTERVDNLSRLVHAGAIAERHRAALRSCGTAAELWRRRSEAFPSLLFGPGVEDDLSRLGGHISGVAEKLAGLDAATKEWKDAGGDAPRWPTKVTPESAKLLADPDLSATRHFPTVRGGTALFHWHARYGRSGRIHLRLDRRVREIEVGYIGPHLPL